MALLYFAPINWINKRKEAPGTETWALRLRVVWPQVYINACKQKLAKEQPHVKPNQFKSHTYEIQMYRSSVVLWNSQVNLSEWVYTSIAGVY